LILRWNDDDCYVVILLLIHHHHHNNNQLWRWWMRGRCDVVRRVEVVVGDDDWKELLSSDYYDAAVVE